MTYDYSDLDHPQHIEWLIDESSRGSFPASDPSSIAQPHRRPRPAPDNASAGKGAKS